MSCTTYRITIKDPLQNENWTKYCNLLQKVRLAHVKSSIKRRQVGNKILVVKRKKFLGHNYNRRIRILEENQNLLKRILAVETRKPVFGINTEDTGKILTLTRNKNFINLRHSMYKKRLRQRENNLLRCRLNKVGPTISIQKMNLEEAKRLLVRKNMSRFAQKEKLTNAQFIKKVKKLLPKPPKSSRKSFKRLKYYENNENKVQTARF